MARRVIILMIIAYGSCMKMRETVERTVMVRRTGSDLQPAATGYIYKRGTNGEAVVTKMGESEVMQQLSKLYEPQAFAESKSNSAKIVKEENPEQKSDKVIPVEEKNDDIDGISDQDYRKNLDEYAASFDDYLKDLASFKDFSNKDFGFDVHHDYDPKVYEKYNAGDYDTKKYESYYLAHEDKPYNDAYGQDYKHKEFNNGNYKGPQNYGFRYKENEKDDKNSNGFHGLSYKYYGDSTKNGEHEQSSERHDFAGDKESDEHDTTIASEDNTTNGYADFGSKSGLAVGKGYTHESKH